MVTQTLTFAASRVCSDCGGLLHSQMAGWPSHFSSSAVTLSFPGQDIHPQLGQTRSVSDNHLHPYLETAVSLLGLMIHMI
jgi:hypothetical protein